jgi:hypothetical protein
VQILTHSIFKRANKIDPWLQVVNWLSERAPDTMCSSHKLSNASWLECNNIAPCNMMKASSISRIEWQTTSTILVSWSDSTLGRYQDQTWRAGLARTSGVCGLTGVPVNKGDVVFRPLIRAGARPTNALDMILADMLLSKAGALLDADRRDQP